MANAHVHPTFAAVLADHAAAIDISVDRHLARHGVPDARDAVERAAAIESALRSMRYLVDHWDADRAYNLCPTEVSLQDARAEMDAALAIAAEG